jgi:hypothetical protein
MKGSESMSAPPGKGVFVTISTPQPNASVGQAFTVAGTFGPTNGALSIATDDGSGTATGPAVMGSGYRFQLSGVSTGQRTVTVTIDAGAQGSDRASVTVTVS